MKFILGRKIEMTQIFREDGTVVPVTLVHAVPCTVTQVKTDENDTYQAVQIGIEPKKDLNKAESGHLKGLDLFNTLCEFRVDDTELKRGDVISADTFEAGERIDIAGWSKGRGFQGVVKRHGFHGAPASHGHKDQLRMPGSIGSKCIGPVAKGKRMPGRMGNNRVTVKNLEVVSVDPEKNILAIKGAVPGARGGLLLISERQGTRVWQK